MMGTCVYEGILYLWRERVFMKRICIYEGNLHLEGKLCIRRGVFSRWQFTNLKLKVKQVF